MNLQTDHHFLFNLYKINEFCVSFNIININANKISFIWSHISNFIHTQALARQVPKLKQRAFGRHSLRNNIWNHVIHCQTLNIVETAYVFRYSPSLLCLKACSVKFLTFIKQERSGIHGLLDLDSFWYLSVIIIIDYGYTCERNTDQKQCSKNLAYWVLNKILKYFTIFWNLDCAVFKYFFTNKISNDKLRWTTQIKIVEDNIFRTMK